MSIYIAGKYTGKERLKAERERMRKAGWVVSSTWMDQPEVGYEFNGSTPEEQQQRKLDEAERDMCEVLHCGWFIIDTLDESATGGREVELGMALAQGAHCTTTRIGPERNIFHAMVDKTFENWDQFYEDLNQDQG